MSRVGLALALAAAFAAGGGCGDDGSIEVPEDVAAQTPAPDSFVKPLGAAVALEPAHDDESYLRDFVEAFGSMTPENEMKWSFVQPEEGEFDFGPGDALVELAETTGKRIRGHTLVWDEQLPDWVADSDWTRAELGRVLREHVRTVVEHYRGRVAEWDVVNEPLENDGSLSPTIWQRVLGPGYIETAFRAAEGADPRAGLFLNELGADLPGPKQRAVLRLGRDLRRRGVPIDGLGFQMHTSLADAPTKQQLLDLFEKVGRAGLAVAITEMDVVIPREGAPGDALERQAAVYRAAAEACVEAANCSGLTVWGVTDEHSWKGAARRPLLLDSDGEPKPALAAVNSVLRRR